VENYAQIYRQMYRYLLDEKKIEIANHRRLFVEAKGFFVWETDALIKNSLGLQKTALIERYHDSCFTRFGIVKHHLDEMSRSVENEAMSFGSSKPPEIIPIDFSIKIHTIGFFTNLSGALDTIAQQIALIYFLDFDDIESIGLGDVLEKVKATWSRRKDKRLEHLAKILKGFRDTYGQFKQYRNHLVHRRFPMFYEYGAGTYTVDIQTTPPAIFDEEGNQIPTTLAKVLYRRLPKSMPESFSPYATIAITVGSFAFLLPKKESLDKNPVEFDIMNDLDDKDIIDRCEQFLSYTEDFVNEVYGDMIEAYRQLQ